MPDPKELKKLAESYKAKWGFYPKGYKTEQQLQQEYMEARVDSANIAQEWKKSKAEQVRIESGEKALTPEQKRRLKIKPPKSIKKPTEAEKQAKKLKTQVSIRKSKEYLAGKKKITKIVRPKEPPTTLVSKYFANILSDAELLHFKKTYIETERAYVEKKYLATGAPPELAKAKAITYIKQKWDFKYGKYFTPERSLVGEIPTRTSEENWWNKEK